MTNYSVADVSRLSGATEADLAEWTSRGIIGADVPADELGQPRMSFFNVLEAAVALEMRRVECPLPVLGETTRYLRWLESTGWKEPEIAADRYFREDAPGFAALVRESRRARTVVHREAGVKEESERFFQTAEDMYRRYFRDACAWAIFRSAASRSALITWLGIAYTFETIDTASISRFLADVPEPLVEQGGYVRVGLIVVPRNGTLTAEPFRRAAVVTALSGLIDRLEAAASDTLDQPVSAAHTA